MENLPLPARFKGLQGSLEDGSFVAIFAMLSAADSSAASGGDGGGVAEEAGRAVRANIGSEKEFVNK